MALRACWRASAGAVGASGWAQPQRCPVGNLWDWFETQTNCQANQCGGSGRMGCRPHLGAINQRCINRGANQIPSYRAFGSRVSAPMKSETCGQTLKQLKDEAIQLNFLRKCIGLLYQSGENPIWVCETIRHVFADNPKACEVCKELGLATCTSTNAKR